MDFTRTNNPTSLFKAASVHPFPEWADTSPIPHAAGLTKLANAAFADSAKRLLPIHTKAASFFSMVDFLDHPNDFGLATGERLKTACENFGIMDDMLPYLREADNSFIKSASSADFAIDVEIGKTPVKLFPLDSLENVREAVVGLTKMANERRLEYTMLRDASLRVMEKAADYREPVNTLLASFAVTRFTDPEKSASLIASRGATPYEQSQYNAVCSDLAAGLDPEEAVTKIAAYDIAFDHNNHLYAGTHLRPHDIVYCGERLDDLTKAASENVLVNGIAIPMSVLASIKTEDLEFGLSKSASASFDIKTDSISLADTIACWSAVDKKTLLHLSLEASL